MRSLALCAVLLLSLPAFSAISQVQNTAKWTCSGTSQTVTCVVTTNNPVTKYNLLAVWTFWESSNGSGGTYPYTTAVADSAGNGTGTPPVFPGAVGPTLQLAATTPTTAQLFYAKNINASTGGDVITVTYSCLYSVGPPATGNPACTTTPSIALAGVVVVEYSGADTMYPLDSVSAGYSTSGNATSLLDSGNAAPANSTLLVFGGGFIDTGASAGIVAGSGFGSIQTLNYSTGSAITEDTVSHPISGNNTLQRATACLEVVSGTCPGSAHGNWLMQMAIFRDASWTVTGAWSPVRIRNVRYADQFPGSDIGDQINHAYADCPSSGCVIQMAPGSYSYSTPVVFDGTHGPANLHCEASPQGTPITQSAVQLSFTPTTGAAITFNDGGTGAAGMEGCTFSGPGYTTSAIGLVCGIGSSQCDGHVFANSGFTKFGIGVELGGAAAFLNTFLNDDVGDNGVNLNMAGTGGNESNKFIGGILSNQRASPANCVDTTNAGGPYDIEFIGTSLDQCMVTMAYTGTRMRFIGAHLEENIPYSTTYPFITIAANCSSCNLQFDASDVQEDNSVTGRTGLIVNNQTGGNPAAVLVYGGHFYGTGGGTIPIVHDAGGANLASVQNTYKNSTVTKDVDGGLSFASLEYGSLTLGGSGASTVTVAPNRYSVLPTCGPSGQLEGYIAAVNDDSNPSTWGTTIAGGGSGHVLAYCDGSSWTVAAK